ncbi:MAG TPA: matrixin family metalloprotease [Motilibacteraceae bacterium]|nr:matrixin family metalloprotease [Motilibacteraceae bacterium]
MRNPRRLLSTGLALAVALSPAVLAGAAGGTAAAAPLHSVVDVTDVVDGQQGAVAEARTGYTVVRQTTCRTVHGAKRCTTRYVRKRTTTPTTTAATKPAATSTTSTEFAFLSKDSSGRPAHWDRCSTITYRVNPANLPSGAMTDIQGALSRLSAASGLTFQYVGTTTVVPYSSSSWANAIPSSQPADLYIAFTDAAHVAYLAGSVAGVGGPFWSSDGTREPRIVRAGVALDTAAGVTPGFTNGASRGTLLLHELGHAVNLDHVTDPVQVMYPSITSQSRPAYQAGDLAGLANLATYPCF